MDPQTRLHDFGTSSSSLSANSPFSLSLLPPHSHSLKARRLSKVSSEFSNPFVQHELFEFKHKEKEFGLSKKREDWIGEEARAAPSNELDAS